MSDILCIYYSRTGNTKKAMEEIASALDAELAELRDGVDRSGSAAGWTPCARAPAPWPRWRQPGPWGITGW